MLYHELYTDYFVQRLHDSYVVFPATPKGFTVIVRFLDICLPRWLRGIRIHFPTLCWYQIKCGSLQIWVSCSFMRCSYSEQLIQTCLSSMQHAAHTCLDVALKNCWGTRATLKITPEESRWAFFVVVVIASANRPKALSRLKKTPQNLSIGYRPGAKDLTSRAFAKRSKCRCMWMSKLTWPQEVNLHVEPHEGKASES